MACSAMLLVTTVPISAPDKLYRVHHSCGRLQKHFHLTLFNMCGLAGGACSPSRPTLTTKLETTIDKFPDVICTYNMYNWLVHRSVTTAGPYLQLAPVGQCEQQKMICFEFLFKKKHQAQLCYDLPNGCNSICIILF